MSGISRHVLIGLSALLPIPLVRLYAASPPQADVSRPSAQKGESDASPRPLVLKADDFRHYVDSFNQHDKELYVQHIPNAAAWAFLRANIPLLDCPDKELEEIFYFRWWTFRKAIKQTPDGFIITEFLPTVGWAGKHNSINCAAGHHLHEGRWLSDPKFLDDYTTFWFRKGGNIRSYSCWIADSIWCARRSPATIASPRISYLT